MKSITVNGWEVSDGRVFVDKAEAITVERRLICLHAAAKLSFGYEPTLDEIAEEIEDNWKELELMIEKLKALEQI